MATNLSKQNTANRVNGRVFEAELVRLWKDLGLPVSRNTAPGETDCGGDIAGLAGLHVEVKRLKSVGDGITRGINKAVDRHSLDSIPVVVAKRPGKNAGRAIVGIEAKDLAAFIKWAYAYVCENYYPGEVVEPPA